VSNTAGAAGEEEQVCSYYTPLTPGETSGKESRRTSSTTSNKGTATNPYSVDVQKPGCHDAVLDYFVQQSPPKVTHPNQIVVIGDRLLTDIMLGSFMQSWTIWFQKGVIPTNDAVKLPYNLNLTMQLTILERGIYNTQNLFKMLPKLPSPPKSS